MITENSYNGPGSQAYLLLSALIRSRRSKTTTIPILSDHFKTGERKLSPEHWMFRPDNG
jgi:hypothetical protein